MYIKENIYVMRYDNQEELIRDCIGYEFSDCLQVVETGGVQFLKMVILDIKIEN